MNQPLTLLVPCSTTFLGRRDAILALAAESTCPWIGAVFVLSAGCGV